MVRGEPSPPSGGWHRECTIDTLGNALDLYDTIEWWDDINHFGNWILPSGAFVALGWPREAATAYRDTLGDLALGLLGSTVGASIAAWFVDRAFREGLEDQGHVGASEILGGQQ